MACSEFVKSSAGQDWAGFSIENGIPSKNGEPIVWRVPLAGIGIEFRSCSRGDERREFVFLEGTLQGMVSWDIYDRKDAIDAAKRSIVKPLMKISRAFSDIESEWAIAHYKRIREFLRENGIAPESGSLGQSGTPELKTQVYYWSDDQYCLKLPFNGEIQFKEIPQRDRLQGWHCGHSL